MCNIVSFGRYREFTLQGTDCWFDRKSKKYESITRGILIEADSKEELKNRLAMALRLAI